MTQKPTKIENLQSIINILNAHTINNILSMDVIPVLNRPEIQLKLKHSYYFEDMNRTDFVDPTDVVGYYQNVMLPQFNKKTMNTN